MTKYAIKSVVITRPLAQATPLAQRVAAIGLHPVVFPLLEISALPDSGPLRAALQDLHRFAMVAFVSPNAIDAAFAHLRSWPQGVAIAVVGEGSRAALAHHGVTSANATIFSPRDPLRTDSQTLLEVLDLEALRGREVLIVRGETGRELLGDALRAAGVQVTPVAAYRRAAPVLDQAGRMQLCQLLDTKNDWVVTSSEALRHLIAMADQLEDQSADQPADQPGEHSALTKMQHQRLIVPHVRIAETATTLGFRNITLTGSGDEQLLAALQSTA
jgi:uroporphyrinogen-III synthase